MAIDIRRIREFVEAKPWRQSLAHVLARANLQISWVSEVPKDKFSDPPRWWLAVKLNKDQKDQFNIGREIVIYVCETNDCQARTITQAVQIIHSDPSRFSTDFAMVLTLDSNTALRVQETSSDLSIAFVGMQLDRLYDFEPVGSSNFVQFIRNELFSRDLYSASTAISSATGFFGRRQLLNDLSTSIKNGTQHVGLFGLRKMGKTSVLLQLSKRIRAAPNTFLAYVDIQKVDAINPSGEYLLWAVGESIVDNAPSLRRISKLELFGKFGRFSAIPDPASVWEMFDHDIKWLLREGRDKICIICDEIELMSPDKTASGWEDSFVRTWRFLRGLSQENAGRIGFCVAGTNPSLFEKNSFRDLENPTYNYFSIRFLERLAKEDCSELLTEIGKRMGLRWEQQALDKVYEHTGGHPFLTRVFASRVSRSCPRSAGESVVSETMIKYELMSVLDDVSAFLGQMTEVLRDQYPDEFALLEMLATGRVGEFRDFAQALPKEVSHLRGYGIIDDPLTADGLSVELLQTWFQRRDREREKSGGGRMSGIEGLRPGSRIDKYEIVATVGRAGGFGQVFRARVAAGGECALKVFRSGNVASLERETEAIRAVSHPGIVRILDFGRSVDGFVYLVMELLNGQTLQAKCERSSRLTCDESIDIAKELLNALMIIHPDEATVDRLRQKDELSPDEYALLAQSRHGFVHRDIKPENVMLVPDRGPVLIDFGISVRASSPVQTLSQTPGYLPPGGIPLQWTPDVDLYQLGVTMLQASVGFTLDAVGIEELRSRAGRELDDPLRGMLIRATSPIQSERFSTAASAIKALY